MRGQQLGENLPAQADGRWPWREHLQARVIGPGLLQGAAEPFATQQGALVQLCADECQALAPARQQVLRRRRAGLQLRETHAVQP
ncbi:hypothetical protein D3C81_2077620 [compost metagenome]